MASQSQLPNLERAVIEVAGGCNYSCGMCPQADNGRGKEWTRKMPLAQFTNILDQLPGKPVINLEGSGEPTLATDLDKYIHECKVRGFPVFMYTNGSRLSGDYMKRVVDAGVDFIRLSCVGYDRETYKEWMSKDNFELLKKNATELKQYISDTNSTCEVSSYHLILDNHNIDNEINLYRTNFIDQVGTVAYIWKMHNWSGNYQPVYIRDPSQRKSCGRPAAPEITIRAGGTDGHTGAVTPCCQTMGPPNEAKSVLGHTDTQTLHEIWNGDLYEELREKHMTGDFDSIEYCKDCDFLYEDPEVLVWSNDPNARTNHMLGTNFSLTDYK